MYNKHLLRFFLLAVASLILTLSMGEILSARPLAATQLIAISANTLQSAENLNSLGYQQLESGNAEAALNTWKQAEIAYQQANNQEGIIGSQLNQAQAMQALGQYWQAEKLLEQINKSIETKPDSEIKILALRSYGDVLRLTGELEESEKVLHESLDLAVLKYPKNISQIKLSLGNTALAQAKRAKAVDDEKKRQAETQKALEFYQVAATDDASITTKLQAKLNLLRLLIDNQQWSDAKNLWPQISDPINQLPVSRLAIEARINLAGSLIETIEKSSEISPDWKAIEQILQAALEQAKSLQNKPLQSYALGNLGSLYEAKKQYLDALNFTDRALILAQQIMNAQDIAYQWQAQLGRLYNVLGKREEAIYAYEKAVETLQYLRKNLLAINPEGQFSFRDDVEPVYRQLVDLLLQPEAGKNEPSQENLHKAIKQIDVLQLAEIENFLRCDLSESVALNEVTDSKAAIIYPIILKDRLAIILQLPAARLKYYETIIPQKDVEDTLKELRSYLIESNRTRDVKKTSQKLYRWLFKPIEQTLKESTQIETLVFVLDGDLRNIPMTVLYDGQKYLMEKYSIGIAPWLQLFTPQPLKQKLKVFIGGVGEEQIINGKPFEKIKYFEQELNLISREVFTGKPIINTNFTKLNIQQQLELGNFSAIHIKTHGVFSSDPDGTYIVAYNDLIKGQDLANLIETNSKGEPNKIELLVLSACETAQGDNRAVLGLAGIAIRAGARSTLSTLWVALDEPNTELMVRFYQELSKPNTTRAKALQTAQKALFERYKAPNVWAPYILVGNWL